MKLYILLILTIPVLLCSCQPRETTPPVLEDVESGPVLTVGEFTRIYDPSIGQQKWYINDHCFIFGNDGKWHLFGITRQEPASPIEEDNFAHAVSDHLLNPQWKKQPFALSTSEKAGESHLWAPHVICYNGTYYMFYCGGGANNTQYRIHLAMSKDLYNWQRHPANPVVMDGYDARDPFILRHKNQWLMYYTATSEPAGGNHIVACRTSKDLVHWSPRKIVFTDPSKGTWGGPTESPTVVKYGDFYYLFIGPRDKYDGTAVYRSRDLFAWQIQDEVARIDSHAAEVIRDKNGKWYVSHCGWGQGGVYLAPLQWINTVPEQSVSLKKPGHCYP